MLVIYEDPLQGVLNLRVTASTLLASRTSSEYSSVRKFISSLCLLGRSCFLLMEFQWTGYSYLP